MKLCTLVPTPVQQALTPTSKMLSPPPLPLPPLLPTSWKARNEANHTGSPLPPALGRLVVVGGTLITIKLSEGRALHTSTLRGWKGRRGGGGGGRPEERDRDREGQSETGKREKIDISSSILKSSQPHMQTPSTGLRHPQDEQIRKERQTDS